jgi:hypothetical protein
MPDIIALRERAIVLAERLRGIGSALDRLDAVTLVQTAAMVNHAAPRENDGDDDEDLRGEEGERYPLLSSQTLLAIIGHGGVDDGDARTFQSNALYYVRRLRQLSSNVPSIERGPEPDLDSLTRFEVVALVEAYKGFVSASAEALIDAHEHVSRLRGERSRMPEYVKGACIGMFGQPDHETRHRYAEGDFKLRNWREEPILPFEKGYVEGRNLTRSVDDRPAVFSARYLAPVFGDPVADEIEAAFDARAGAVAPRPGDPKPPFRFSHRDKASVEVAYAPGEVDVDEDHGRREVPRM